MKKIITGALLALYLLPTLGLSQATTSISITPTRVDLPSAKPVSAVTIRNSADKAKTLQIRAVQWSQKNGEDNYQKTNDLVVVPASFTLAPNDSQLIRMGLRTPSTTSQELAYRIFIEEIPNKASPVENAIQTLIKISLPVFVIPASPLQQLSWNIQKLSGNSAKVQIRNQGNVHILLSKIDLALTNEQNPFFNQDTFAYILPGQQKSWNFKLKNSLATSTIKITATTDSGKITKNITVSD